jgi:hypothetical protein
MRLKKSGGFFMNIKKIGKFCTPLAAAAFFMLAGPLQNTAKAGPTIEFGEDGEGLLRIDYKAQFQGIFREGGSGKDGLSDTSTMNFRRNRIQLVGAWGEKYGMYVQTDFVEDLNVNTLGVGHDFGSYFTLLDAQFRYNYNEMFNVRVGKFKANFARENLEDCYQPLTLDRSLFLKAPFVVSRDIGVAVWGNLLDGKVQYRADVLEGRTADDVAPDSGFRYSGRVHLSLLDPEKGYGYRGTYRGNKKVLTIGLAGQFETDVVYGDLANKVQPENYKAWTADIFTEYPIDGIGTVTFSAAYMDVGMDEAYQGADPEAEALGLSGERNGYYVKAAYMLPNIPLQLFARYEGWTFASLEGVINQDLDWTGVGANYYVNGQNLKLTVEYANTDFAKEATDCTDFDTFRAQLQFIF